MNKLEKYWPIITLVILAILLVALLFWPTLARPLAWILIIVGCGMAILFSAKRNYRLYRDRKLSRNAGLVRFILEIASLAISIIITVWIVGKIVFIWLLPYSLNIERMYRGWGKPVALIAGLVFALLVGSIIGLLIRRVQQRIYGD